MSNNKQKIYSIQSEVNCDSLIEIETVILNGLYRFSILGINHKNSTDTKDRIYSALRSQKLINLKSDNKKITVNLLPTNVDKKTNIYDLGIALGCLSCMNQIEITEDVIVVGELSILGKIIPSNFLLKSIYHSIKNNIKTIICSQYDFDTLNKSKNSIRQIIKDNKIKFISSDNLGDLIKDIKDKKYSTLTDTFDQNAAKDINSSLGENIGNINTYKDYTTSKLDINILKVILALCTKKNIFIENNKNCYIKKYIRNLIYHSREVSGSEILELSNIINKKDDEILKEYLYPKVSNLDSQTQKNDLYALLNESIFGFNIIEDFLSMNDDSLYTIKKFYRSSIFCFYNPCPCGNNNIFFNSIDSSKCLCIQRNILRYRQRIKKTENGFFDFYINNTNVKTVEYAEYDEDEYILINTFISRFRNTEVKIEDSLVSNSFIRENVDKFERNHLDNIISLAKDITKLDYIISKSDCVLSKENINLAVALLKKDF